MTLNLTKHYFILIIIIVFGQKNFCQNSKDSKLKIEGANQLFLEKKYDIAKSLWSEIVIDNPENSNINYKTGVSFLESKSGRINSLKYLKVAAQKVNKVYSPFDNTINTAPLEVFYYLGKSYHLNNSQDSSIKYLKQFINVVSKKHYLKGDAEKLIKQCENFKLVTDNSKNHKIINSFISLNTNYNEFNPLVSLNGSSILFTSDRQRNSEETSNEKIFDVATGNHFYDIYIAQKNSLSNTWDTPKLLNISKLRTNEIGIGASYDNEKIFLANGVKTSKKGNAIRFSRKIQNFYTAKQFNSFADYNMSSIAVTEDEMSVIFSSNKSGGYGGEDLWFSTKKDDGSWSKPINMGPNINSSHDEISPFIHPDQVTLFFSSNSDKSIGGYDVLFSTKDSQGNWQEAKNLGIPINTVNDEKYFSTSTDGTQGYYSSMNDKENYDLKIVEITIPYSRPTMFLSGYIDKKNLESLENNYLVKLTNSNSNEEIKVYKPNNFNGSYIFKVEECHLYDVKYYRLVTLSSGTEKESLIHEQTIKTKCESFEKIMSPVLLPTIDYNGNIVDVVEENNSKKKLITEFKERNKKYDFKEIIGKENKLIALLLIDENGNIVDKAILTPEGFKFKILNYNSNYNFKIENFPDSLDLSDIPIFLLQDNEETLIHGDFEKSNTFTYLNNFSSFKFKEIMSTYGKNMKLFLVDKDGNVIEKGILTNNGFKFKLISAQQEYSFRLENFPDGLDLSEIPIEIINHNESLLVLGDFSKGNKYVLPKIHFKKSFQLGQYSIENDERFISFMEETVKRIQAGSRVKFDIVGSASKIPSKKYSSNTELAKIRVEKGKKYIYDYLKNENIPTDKIIIVKEKAIVSGPEFDPNDNNKNKYYEFQYFSIWAE
ncbi:MAG: hypothetical protein P8N69_06410 [Flavobacteriales bacterium]|nr:hypothetical protein [Flavobacteriales bacterium]